MKRIIQNQFNIMKYLDILNMNNNIKSKFSFV